MYAAVKTIATLLSLLFFIDRAGRRKLLLTSSIGTSLALWYIGGFVTASHIDLTKPQAKSVAGWIAIVCVYIYAVCFPLLSSITPLTRNLLTLYLGFLLLRLERRRLGILCRDLPHAHQGTRRLNLHLCTMAFSIRHRSRITIHAHLA